MPNHHARWATVFSACLLATAACGPNGSSGGTGGGGAATSTSSSGTPMAACAKDSRVIAYAVGVEAKAQDGLVVKFMDADPAPPSKGNNTWTVQITDAQGKPVNGATIVTKPFMPDHGHASSIKPQATAKDMNGTYEINPVNLFMPGVWQITFDVTAPGVTSSAVIDFCVDG